MARTTRRTPRILVVDDDPGLLRLLTIRLRSEKYEVEPVSNAAAALEAIGRFRPDLVVTDLRMGQEPAYVFAFHVPAARAWTGLLPRAVGGRLDIARGLQWLWPRMLGADLPPPR